MIRSNPIGLSITLIAFHVVVLGPGTSNELTQHLNTKWDTVGNPLSFKRRRPILPRNALAIVPQNMESRLFSKTHNQFNGNDPIGSQNSQLFDFPLSQGRTEINPNDQLRQGSNNQQFHGYPSEQINGPSQHSGHIHRPHHVSELESSYQNYQDDNIQQPPQQQQQQQQQQSVEPGEPGEPFKYDFSDYSKIHPHLANKPHKDSETGINWLYEQPSTTGQVDTVFQSPPSRNQFENSNNDGQNYAQYQSQQSPAQNPPYPPAPPSSQGRKDPVQVNGGTRGGFRYPEPNPIHSIDRENGQNVQFQNKQPWNMMVPSQPNGVAQNPHNLDWRKEHLDENARRDSYDSESGRNYLYPSPGNTGDARVNYAPVDSEGIHLETKDQNHRYLQQQDVETQQENGKFLPKLYSNFGEAEHFLMAPSSSQFLFKSSQLPALVSFLHFLLMTLDLVN